LYKCGQVGLWDVQAGQPHHWGFLVINLYNVDRV
jgi:hypothetical protein